jgi:hypothetical protein
MLGNAIQSSRGFIGRFDDFWYLERLPPAARRALCDAAFDWAAGWFYLQWRRGKRGFKTGPDIAVRIAEADARQIAKDRQRVWKIKP